MKKSKKRQFRKTKKSKKSKKGAGPKELTKGKRYTVSSLNGMFKGRLKDTIYNEEDSQYIFKDVRYTDNNMSGIHVIPENFVIDAMSETDSSSSDIDENTQIKIRQPRGRLTRKKVEEKVIRINKEQVKTEIFNKLKEVKYFHNGFSSLESGRNMGDNMYCLPSEDILCNYNCSLKGKDGLKEKINDWVNIISDLIENEKTFLNYINQELEDVKTAYNNLSPEQIQLIVTEMIKKYGSGYSYFIGPDTTPDYYQYVIQEIRNREQILYQALNAFFNKIITFLPSKTEIAEKLKMGEYNEFIKKNVEILKRKKGNSVNYWSKEAFEESLDLWLNRNNSKEYLKYWDINNAMINQSLRLFFDIIKSNANSDTYCSNYNNSSSRYSCIKDEFTNNIRKYVDAVLTIFNSITYVDIKEIQRQQEELEKQQKQQAIRVQRININGEVGKKGMEGFIYLKAPDGKIYDATTKEEIGIWENNQINFY